MTLCRDPNAGGLAYFKPQAFSLETAGTSGCACVFSLPLPNPYYIYIHEKRDQS